MPFFELAFKVQTPVWRLMKLAFQGTLCIYVDWPEDAYTSHNTTLNMCVVGQARFVSYLDVFESALIRRRRVSSVK